MREIAEDGIRARFYETSGDANSIAVVMFDGAGGGYPTDPQPAAALAAAGYPTLAVAYFRNRLGEPDGLPAALCEIPVEYGIKCIEWLRRQPGIMPDGIVILGQSRGTELVLLLATRCEGLAGIALFSPSDVLWQSSTFQGEPKSAWTERGTGLPFHRFAYAPGNWLPESAASAAYVQEIPEAVIPVERITCPVLLISSRDDRIWPAAKMADAISARMTGTGRQPQNLQFDDASHVLMGFGDAPIRVSVGPFTMELGGTEAGTRRARDAGWAALFRFLEELQQNSRRPGQSAC
jgi:dienelactone hydrolase